jgi:hypothetical protein
MMVNRNAVLSEWRRSIFPSYAGVRGADPDGHSFGIAWHHGFERSTEISDRRLIPLAPALPTFGDERAIGARLQRATDKMPIAPEATV